MEETGFLWAAGAAILTTFVVAASFARWLDGVLARHGLASPPSGARNAALDGLRGVLALAVVSHHVLIWVGLTRFERGWTPPAFAPFNHLGLGAVVLFFMITGYVFAPFLARGDLGSWPRLVLRRLFRLQPLVLLSVALVCALCLFARGGTPGAGDPRAALIWLSCWGEPDLFGISGAGRFNAHVLWSLKFEWLFTLVLLPLCVLARDACPTAFSRKKTLLAPGALLLLAAGLQLVLPENGLAASVALLAPPFLIGMILHEALTRARIRAVFAKPWGPPLAVLALAVAMSRAPTPLPPMQLALYSLFFCTVAARKNLSLLTGPGIQALGAWSFPIYLLHGIVLSLLFVEGDGIVTSAPPLATLALLPALACVVVAAAALAHVTVERPAAAFGQKLAALWPTPTAGARGVEA
jgi:peptidoglycan/LPS O-acetylase OafA/YrhL